MPTKQAFCVDLYWNSSIVPIEKLEVTEYEPEDLAYELREFGVSNPEDLTDYDRCVFKTEEEAEAFLREYRRVYATLGKIDYCIDRNLPAMAYRRRNLVQTLMGYKLQTVRNYRREDLRAGDLFNLHDRTHFVTVRLKRIVKAKDGTYKYEFELI